MKLRIRGNSLRLRLTKGEVERVVTDHFIEGAISFGGEKKLTYVLMAADVPGVRADFHDSRIVVSAPRDVLRRWATNEEVGIEGQQPVDEGSLAVLVEKDFACLTKHSNEDDADAYPNPNKSC